jgi:hypothetical protein
MESRVLLKATVEVVGYLAASQGHWLKTPAAVFPEHTLVKRTELVYLLYWSRLCRRN